jgi:hypothetical protein
MSTMRFCPCCAMVGRRNYTAWKNYMIRTYCENSMYAEHLTYISRGVYWVYIGGLSLSCGCSYGRAYDEDIRCDHVRHIYPMLHESMIVAMEAEARAGTFCSAMWAPTFPRRAAEARARRRAMIDGVLWGKLLPPLCDIVADYEGN